MFNNDLEKVEAKLTEKLKLLKTKSAIYSWIDSLEPKDGVIYVSSLKAQVEENKIENKEILLLKYRDYISILRITTSLGLVFVFNWYSNPLPVKTLLVVSLHELSTSYSSFLNSLAIISSSFS